MVLVEMVDSESIPSRTDKHHEVRRQVALKTM
jgi:hypothetical protein